MALHAAGCASCGATPNSGLCACKRCHKASYCNQKCQLDHWHTHKTLCKTTKLASEVGAAIDTTTKPEGVDKTTKLASEGGVAVDQNTKLELHCASCGCRHPEKGKKLLACTKCYMTVYCSKACQKKDWKMHKQSCKKISAPVFQFHLVGDANTPMLKVPDCPETIVHQDEIRNLVNFSGQALNDEVERLARHYKTFAKGWENKGELLESARTHGARAALYMAGYRLAEAKQCSEKAYKRFWQWVRVHKHKSATEMTLSRYVYQHIDMNATMIDATFLQIENDAMECKMDNDDIAGPQKYACALELVSKLAEEQVKRDKMQAWDRSIDIDHAVINTLENAHDGKAHDDTGHCEHLLYRHAKHAVEIQDDPAKKTSIDFEEMIVYCRKLMKKLGDRYSAGAAAAAGAAGGKN